MRAWSVCVGLLVLMLPFAGAEELDGSCEALTDPDTLVFEGGPVDTVADNQGERTADTCEQAAQATVSAVDDGEALATATEEQLAGDASGTPCWLAPGTPGC